MLFKTLVVGTLVVASGCVNSEPSSPLSSERPVFQELPADGNGNKIVLPIEFNIPAFTTCPNGATIDLHIVGWIQGREVNQVPQSVFANHFEFIYSNAAGQTYTWHTVGIQHFYFNQAGDLILATNARTLDNVGRVVVNITKGEVVEFVAGRQPNVDGLVCAALT